MAEAAKRPRGRPKKDINLVELQRLCTLNCTMPEIAAFFDLPLRTLEDRYTNDEEVRSTIQKGRELGKLSIRRKQMQIMEQQNNATMAIWLGKNLLGQRDNLDVVTEDKNQTAFSEALDLLGTIASQKKASG